MSQAMAEPGLPASAIPSRVTAASAKERMRVFRTPKASATEPTTTTRPTMAVAKMAAHQPAVRSSIPKSPVSHKVKVGRKEKIPSHSRKVAR